MAKAPSTTSSGSEDDSTDSENVMSEGKEIDLKKTDDVAEEDISEEETESEGSDEEETEKVVETKTDQLPINLLIEGPKEIKHGIVRIFTDDSVFAILEGMYDYLTQNGVEHFQRNKDSFYEFLKEKLLPMSVTTGQLKEKIRKLRFRFVNHVSKKSIIVKSYEKKVFELSEKIWGKGSHLAVDTIEMSDIKGGRSKRKLNRDENMNDGGENYDKKAKLIDIEKPSVGKENCLDWDLYPRVKESLESQNLWHIMKYKRISHEKAKEFEDKWELYQVEEANLNMKKLDLIKEQTSLFLNELVKH